MFSYHKYTAMAIHAHDFFFTQQSIHMILFFCLYYQNADIYSNADLSSKVLNFYVDHVACNCETLIALVKWANFVPAKNNLVAYLHKSPALEAQCSRQSWMSRRDHEQSSTIGKHIPPILSASFLRWDRWSSTGGRKLSWWQKSSKWINDTS